MRQPILVEFYEALTAGGRMEQFIRRMRKRYTEGTLQRLLTSPESQAREAALVGLRFLGTMASNALIGDCLRDRRPRVRELAEGTLWSIWFRADSPKNAEELQRLARLVGKKEYAPALLALNRLIRRSPQFAEAYNQRAIIHWRRGDYRKAVADCKRVLALNPCHFGAQAGMAQCYLQMQRPDLALQAFRAAYKINPNLDGIADSIQALEQILHDE